MKRCSMCTEVKDFKDFSKSNVIKDGHQGYCKQCSKQYRNIKGLNKGVGRGRPRKTTRVCTRCDKEKNIREFKNYYFCIQCTKNRGHVKRYTEEEIKERRKESSRRCNQKHKEQRKATRKKYMHTERGKKLRTEQARKYRSTSNGIAVEKSIKHRRRARKKSGGVFTAKEWKSLIEQYNHTCLCCKRSNVKLTPDHIKPLALGGSNNIDNIQPLCLECNVKKGVTEVDYR